MLQADHQVSQFVWRLPVRVSVSLTRPADAHVHKDIGSVAVFALDWRIDWSRGCFRTLPEEKIWYMKISFQFHGLLQFVRLVYFSFSGLLPLDCDSTCRKPSQWLWLWSQRCFSYYSGLTNERKIPGGDTNIFFELLKLEIGENIISGKVSLNYKSKKS